MILSDATLGAICGRPDLQAEFPFMRLQPVKAAGGGCCGGRSKARQQVQGQLDAIRNQLMGLSPERKQRLKDMLMAQEVVIYLPGGAKHTF